MKKLILFDIDGTLIRGKFPGYLNHWQERVVGAIAEVFEVSPNKPDPKIYNGFVDKNLMWYLTRDAGVPRNQFKQKYSQLATVFHRKTREDNQRGIADWIGIPEAIALLDRIKTSGNHAMGVITGNIEANGWLKLERAGVKHYFEFGVFADSVNDRFELARYAKKKAKLHFGYGFHGTDTIVIGDTKHDVRSGKAIKAFTVAVCTGTTETKESLRAEKPDLLVDSLMDEPVLTLLGLQ